MQVVLADNQAIFRTGTSRVLALEDDIHVAAQCSDEERLKEAVGALRQSVVIFPSSISRDLHDLLDWIEQANSRSVMILEHGTDADESVLQRVEGVVLRSVAGPQLVECIHRVAAGERSVQRATIKPMPSPDRVGARVVQRLTPKELQIIALVTDGAKNKDIATQLNTKEQVVKNYLRSIYDKTGVSDRLELALYTVHHRALAEAIELAHPLRSKRA
ncbi:response regulator transcription factor [Granulicella cerasi]|uniref:Response regulator transcription factor n=1 Tax=Granulicella cerasi TaxID=741063 RepID=A0ABW1Z7Q1_9BACT|nr:response regulator transcription factor [Granulicella cerasi]